MHLAHLAYLAHMAPTALSVYAPPLTAVPSLHAPAALPPLTDLITFSCYGSHLHGDDSGSVDTHHCLPGTPVLDPNPPRRQVAFTTMVEPPFTLDEAHRATVLRAIVEVCRYRAWHLLAAHVRTTHVHVVIESEAPPERIMIELKAYATRALKPAAARCRYWSRHGSTRWINQPAGISAAVSYVVHEQGSPMAVFDESASPPPR